MRLILILETSRSFTGKDFHENGVGGTQAAVTMLAEGFTLLGHEVTVVTPTKETKEYRKVLYCNRNTIPYTNFDIILLFRNWSDLVERLTTKKKIFYSTDLKPPSVEGLQKAHTWADRTLLMSEYQGHFFKHSLFPESDFQYTPVGLPICSDDYNDFLVERENLILYCSVPDRGLLYLKDIFLRIQKAIPDVRLAVTSDFTLWGSPSAVAEYSAHFKNKEGIHFYGALPRPQLVALQKKAKVMVFPCNFTEGFCIAAAECMAAGAVPVTTKDFALETTVADSGILIEGSPESRKYQDIFVGATTQLLSNNDYWLKKARKGRDNALSRFRPERVTSEILESI